jgi:hypothetical protein
MKKVFALIVVLLAFALIVPGARAQSMNWKTTNQITVAWDAVTTMNDGSAIPSGSTVQYQVYIRTDPSGTPAQAGSPVTATQATVTFSTEGSFDVGVSAQRMVSSSMVSESPISWSNDPAATNNNPFGVKYWKVPAAPQNIR